MFSCAEPHRCWIDFGVKVEMVWIEMGMVPPVGVDNVVVVVVLGVGEAVHDKIEGCDTLLDMVGDLKPPHLAMRNWDDFSTPDCKSESKDCSENSVLFPYNSQILEWRREDNDPVDAHHNTVHRQPE